MVKTAVPWILRAPNQSLLKYHCNKCGKQFRLFDRIRPHIKPYEHWNCRHPGMLQLKREQVITFRGRRQRIESFSYGKVKLQPVRRGHRRQWVKDGPSHWYSEATVQMEADTLKRKGPPNG